jgi:hypothetical protein
VSYLNSLLIIKQFPDADIVKGKMTVDQSQGFTKQVKLVDGRKKVRKRWEPSGAGIVKINVDGAFSRDDRACIGIIGRDQQDATEAEIMAIEEGVKLALQWTQMRFSVESDCSEMINEAFFSLCLYNKCHS